jgi:hypothetical protein
MKPTESQLKRADEFIQRMIFIKSQAIKIGQFYI